MKNVVLKSGYEPNSSEEFMNEYQKEYFRQKLLVWKESLLRETENTLLQLKSSSTRHADPTDFAVEETSRSHELRARNRGRKLISKIEAALRRLEHDEYGYCEETGEPIALKRLEARPIATLSLEAQEQYEKMERLHRAI